MKPKLLITMGDSNTEGVGCWDPKIIKFPFEENGALNYAANMDRFHKLGWPSRLQVKLRYDRLINLGHGGCSDSFQLKSFIENISENELNNYEVLVIWLMTFSGRFSFYQERKVKSLMANSNNENFPELHRFYMGYLDFINDLTEDCALEQLYHIRLFRKLCKGLNINFLFSSADNYQRIFLYNNCSEHFNTSDNLDLYVNNTTYGDVAHLIDCKTFIPNFIARPDLKSKVCSHPNEQGYEFIAENMFNIIKNNFSYLVNRNHPREFKQEWRDVKQW